MSNFIMGGASRRNGFTDAAAAGLATALLVLIGGILLYVAHRCRRKLSLTNRRNPAAGYLDPVPVAVPIPGVSDALPTASAFAVWVRERGFSEDEDHLSTPMPNPANLGV